MFIGGFVFVLFVTQLDHASDSLRLFRPPAYFIMRNFPTRLLIRTLPYSGPKSSFLERHSFTQLEVSIPSTFIRCHFYIEGQVEASHLGIWSAVRFRSPYFTDQSRKIVFQVVGRSCYAISCLFGQWREVYIW